MIVAVKVFGLLKITPVSVSVCRDTCCSTVYTVNIKCSIGALSVWSIEEGVY